MIPSFQEVTRLSSFLVFRQLLLLKKWKIQDVNFRNLFGETMETMYSAFTFKEKNCMPVPHNFTYKFHGKFQESSGDSIRNQQI